MVGEDIETLEGDISQELDQSLQLVGGGVEVFGDDHAEPGRLAGLSEVVEDLQQMMEGVQAGCLAEGFGGGALDVEEEHGGLGGDVLEAFAPEGA